MKEQREHPRRDIPLHIEFNYFADSGGGADPDASKPSRGFGRIMDISLGGVSMITSARMTPQQPLSLFFTMSGDIDAIDRRVLLVASGTVLRTAPYCDAVDGPRADEQYAVAVQFTEPQFELSELLANR